ncbi:magnesium transporter [Seminavis robusta]|uniref:Magnesium transporter n=1 Tax=Seminavis robusta TaxID=568900 RepID=A0A9N8HHX5_9STRA|nr:magnesium transporter [Seminavis robusta]|eukprot:Sro739_g195410.1 magnesium transporter (1202) ;mRNA; r:26407-30084
MEGQAGLKDDKEKGEGDSGTIDSTTNLTSPGLATSPDPVPVASTNDSGLIMNHDIIETSQDQNQTHNQNENEDQNEKMSAGAQAQAHVAASVEAEQDEDEQGPPHLVEEVPDGRDNGHLRGQDPMSVSLSAVDDGSVGVIDMSLPVATLPGPLREEPTLKEKLVDRERQRRKEAERGRLKRQFALMSNGGGLVYDGVPSTTGTGAIRENGSITGTVGEESSVAAHADLDDSISHSHHGHHAHPHHRHQTQDQSAQPLGYTMERFLQERDTNNNSNNNSNNSNSSSNNNTATASSNNAQQAMSQAESAAIATVMTSMIREEEEPDKRVVMERFLKDPPVTISQAEAAARATVMEASTTNIRQDAIEPDTNTSRATDKGVVMERFLKEPVVVDADSNNGMQDDDDDDDDPSTNRPDDVHRSVSFDIDLQPSHHHRSASGAGSSTNNQAAPPREHLLHNMQVNTDGSNASVQVEVAPEDNLNLMEPTSPGGGLSIPSVVAPSSIATDDQHHRRQETEMSLGSGGPSIDRQSSGDRPNGRDHDDDTDDEPRLFRLTEAEIQEMAAIEEASIGNAPPSDRDAESLVGDLVGTFGSPNVGEVDPAGTTFSQGTPTTAMESGSILSGMPQRSSVQQDDDGQHRRMETMDDLDHNSIDGMPMSASVSSRLGVSPGASVSGSAASVTANPPSEIIGRIEQAPVLLMDEMEGSATAEHALPQPQSSAPPSSVVLTEDVSSLNPMAVGTNTGTPHLNQPAASQHRMDAMSMLQLGDHPMHDLQGDNLPVREEIVNRRIRPGMVNLEQLAAASPAVPLHVSSPMTNSRPMADNMIGSGNSLLGTPSNTRNVEEFDFDKNDLPMTPRSLLSDSLHDLPGDDLWTSPSAKMSVSPINRRNHNSANLNTLQSTTIDRLMVPNMSQPTTDSSKALRSPPPTGMKETEAKFPTEVVDGTGTGTGTGMVLVLLVLYGTGTGLSHLEDALSHVQLNRNSVVETKHIEAYCRRSTLSKALQTRLLPLLLTGLIEIPVMLTLARSDRLCGVLGRHYHELFLAFVPLLAAISGNMGLQSSQLTATAIVHGHVTSATLKDWVRSECSVSLLLGVGLGTVVGLASIVLFRDTKEHDDGRTNASLVFGLVLGLSQTVSAIAAGCSGSLSPVFLSWLLKGSQGVEMNGVFERALQDVMSALLSSVICYILFALLVSPLEGASDGCVA